MNAIINEQVNVVTVYNPKSNILPWKIKWRHHLYTITKLGFHHKVKAGRTLYHIFSVTNGSMFFRLRFDTETLSWVLEEVSDGLAS